MLDNRLEMIYSLLPRGVVCDIGADHGKLPCAAVLRGKAPYAYAADLRLGPLSAAKRTAERLGVSDKITLVQSDGLLDLPERAMREIDSFAIAGMGGELIESILRARRTEKPLVLQPMSAIYELEEFLSDGYEILRRVYSAQGDKLYTAWLCRYNGVKREFSPFSGAEKSEAFYSFLQRERRRIQTALSGLKKGETSDDRQRRERELCAILEIIEREIK